MNIYNNRPTDDIFNIIRRQTLSLMKYRHKFKAYEYLDFEKYGILSRKEITQYRDSLERARVNRVFSDNLIYKRQDIMEMLEIGSTTYENWKKNGRAEVCLEASFKTAKGHARYYGKYLNQFIIDSKVEFKAGRVKAGRRTGEKAKK